MCEIRADTSGDNCKNFCEALGRPCLHAQDNVGQCGVGQDHTRQDMDDNGERPIVLNGANDRERHASKSAQSDTRPRPTAGCNQNWGGQICGCGMEGYFRVPAPVDGPSSPGP